MPSLNRGSARLNLHRRAPSAISIKNLSYVSRNGGKNRALFKAQAIRMPDPGSVPACLVNPDKRPRKPQAGAVAGAN